MAAVTICSDFGVQENKICHCFRFFPIYLPWGDGTRCHHLSYLNVEFQASFFTLLYLYQEALSSSSLSAIRVVSSAYLRLLIFLLAILIPACASSTLAFHMMYSAYKLNKQGDNIQQTVEKEMGISDHLTSLTLGLLNIFSVESLSRCPFCPHLSPICPL